MDQGIGLERDVLGAYVDATCIDDDALGDELLADIIARNSNLRYAFPVELDVDDFGQDPKELDLRDVFHENQLAAKELGEVVKLAIAVLVSVERQEHAEHVGVVVIDQRGACARGQVRLRVTHLAAELIPNLR